MDRRGTVVIIAVLLALAYVLFFRSLQSGITAHGGVSPTTVEPGGTLQVWIDSIDGGLYDNPHTITYSEDSQKGWCGTGNNYGDYYCMAPVSVTSWWDNSVCDSAAYSYLMAAASNQTISYDAQYDDFGFKEVGNSGILYYGLASSRTTSLHPFNEHHSLLGTTFDFTVALRWYNQSSHSANYFAGVCAGTDYPDVSFVSSDNGSSAQRTVTFTYNIAGNTYYCKVVELSPPSSSTWDNVTLRGSTIYPFYIVLGLSSLYNGTGNGSYTYKLRLASVTFRSGGIEAYIYPANDGGDFGSTIPVYNCVFNYTVSNNGCTIADPTHYTYHVSSSAADGNYQFLFFVKHDDYCGFADMGPTDYGNSQTGNYLEGAKFRVVNYADSVTLNSVSVSSSDDKITTASITVSGGTTFDRVDVSSSCGGSKSIQKLSFSCSGSTCTWSGTLGFDTSTSGEVSSGSRSCTVTAKLIVNGSQKASDSKTVTVYYPQVQNLSVPDTTSRTVSFSFRACGAFNHYVVYLDSTSNQVGSGTVDPPSSPGGCRDVSSSVTVDNLTSGTHTLYVRLYTSDSGEYDTASATFNANITYSGSVSVTAPEKGSVINQQVSSPGVPSSPVTTSASYSTDAPSATLKVYVNGSEKQSWTVSESGSKSYTAQSSDLTCGTDTFEWKLFNQSNLLASDSSSVTLRCWYDSVGPEGNVLVPSSDGSPLASSYVDVYVDASVSPEANYSVQLLWNSTDISSKLTSENCSHTYCARITPSDVPDFNCGNSVTLTSKLLEGSTVRATSTSTITLQCVERYVIIREPSNGSAFDTNGQQPPSDFEVNVGIDYAGGDTLAVYLNGTKVTPRQLSNCSYDVCYALSGFRRGENNIYVELYNGSDLVATDHVDINVYAWAYVTSVNYGSDTALVSVSEYGSHATKCEFSTDRNTWSSMLYSSADSSWNYQVSKDLDGSDYYVRCYSPTGKQVYFYSGVLHWSAGSSGGAAGGVSEQAPPQPEEVVPFWPTVASVGELKWTVLDREGFDANVFTSASVSKDYVCVVSTDVPEVRVCTGSVPSIPDSQAALNSIVNSLQKSGCHVSVPSNIAGLYCVKNEGAGLYVFDASGHVARILESAPSRIDVVYVASLVFAILMIVYLLLRGGVLGL